MPETARKSEQPGLLGCLEVEGSQVEILASLMLMLHERPSSSAGLTSETSGYGRARVRNRKVRSRHSTPPTAAHTPRQWRRARRVCALDDAAAFHEYDPIGRRGLREAVRHDERGAAPHRHLGCALQEAGVARDGLGGGLVEHDDGGVDQQRARGRSAGLRRVSEPPLTRRRVRRAPT